MVLNKFITFNDGLEIKKINTGIAQKIINMRNVYKHFEYNLVSTLKVGEQL